MGVCDMRDDYNNIPLKTFHIYKLQISNLLISKFKQNLNEIISLKIYYIGLK